MYVTEELNAARILAHGKITSLATKFNLKGVPFSIFIIPKAETFENQILIDVKLAGDKESSNCPFNLGGWTEPAIVEIAASELLTDYDIYYGAGQKLED